MSRLLILPVAAAFAAVAITACSNTPTRPAPPIQEIVPKLAPTPTISPTPSVYTPSVTPPPTQSTGEIKYAKPVSGKPGFVTLPGSSGLIDVRGFAPGEQVKDPATGQMFLVP